MSYVTALSSSDNLAGPYRGDVFHGMMSPFSSLAAPRLHGQIRTFAAKECEVFHPQKRVTDVRWGVNGHQ